jgi:hypothetical protein
MCRKRVGGWLLEIAAFGYGLVCRRLRIGNRLFVQWFVGNWFMAITQRRVERVHQRHVHTGMRGFFPGECIGVVNHGEVEPGANVVNLRTAPVNGVTIINREFELAI